MIAKIHSPKGPPVTPLTRAHHLAQRVICLIMKDTPGEVLCKFLIPLFFPSPQSFFLSLTVCNFDQYTVNYRLAASLN